MRAALTLAHAVGGHGRAEWWIAISSAPTSFSRESTCTRGGAPRKWADGPRSRDFPLQYPTIIALWGVERRKRRVDAALTVVFLW